MKPASVMSVGVVTPAARAHGSLRPFSIPFGEIVVIAAAGSLAWIVDEHPLSLLPVAPWHFSWVSFIGVGFGLLWFCRGLRRTPAATRPTIARRVCFLGGLALIYVVVLTEFEYFTQHMFFLNRVQHAVLHHLGPFLIALSWPVDTMARGVPAPVLRCCRMPLVRRAVGIARQPVVAFLLFEGLLAFWLIPAVAYRAMLDWPLYEIMNASMVVDGFLFWFLVLDPRPAPPAPIGFFPRLMLAFLVIFPQIGIGTAIGLVQHDLYPAFALCGRVFQSIGPLADQEIGGLVIWVPTGMMSALASLVIMRRMFIHEDHMKRSLA